MKFDHGYWLRFSLLNIILVACLGVLMRYKIGFELPAINQKYLQHAHSHFAFSAWITHTLYLFLCGFIGKFLSAASIKKYYYLLISNLVLGYGMLIAFSLQGYGGISITLSQLSILVNFIFAFFYIRDLKHAKMNPASHWFKAALWFQLISSLGTYALVYLMVTKHILQSVYLGSVYFYLHFQYNGWFFFAAAGLLISKLIELAPDFKYNKSAFNLLLLSCVPAYFLSVLWLKLPVWLYILVVLASMVQIFAWAKLWGMLKNGYKLIKDKIPVNCRNIFLLVALSLSLKFVLQLGSVIPSVSHIAFEFRPIVIAYLHLVLLAVFSLFLLTYMQAFKYQIINSMTKTGLILFVTGVFLNEIALGVQGIAAILYIRVPFINETLFGIAVIMLISLLILFSSHNFRKGSSENMNS